VSFTPIHPTQPKSSLSPEFEFRSEPEIISTDFPIRKRSRTKPGATLPRDSANAENTINCCFFLQKALVAPLSENLCLLSCVNSREVHSSVNCWTTAEHWNKLVVLVLNEWQFFCKHAGINYPPN
jgi:hypothetical protein